MPTKHPRVALTLPPEVLEVLDRMGRVSGAGRATIIREWLLELLPQLAQVAQAMELAASKNLDAFKLMERALRDASGEADQLRLDIKRSRRAAMRKRAR